MTSYVHSLSQQHSTLFVSRRHACNFSLGVPMDLSQDPPSRLQADTAWLEGLRRQIRSPSQRNPDMSWENNAADLIERQLQDDGHRTWGFLIYRTTYASDADWAEFLRRLRFQMEDMFDYFNGRDILDKFALTVFEDRPLFDGASTNAVRQHFQQWSAIAYQTEQQSEEDRGSSEGIPDRVGIGRSPRYRFAVQVDVEALYSIVYNAPAPPELDNTKKGWVKLIDKSWYLGRSEGKSGPLEPIEAVTEPDIGWMKVPYQNAMTEYYTKCRSLNNWNLNYCRPPKVAGSP